MTILIFAEFLGRLLKVKEELEKVLTIRNPVGFLFSSVSSCLKLR